MVEGNDPVFHQFQPGSPQVVELKIVIEVLKQCSFAFNLLSDSLYVVNALKILETAGPIKPSSPIVSLMSGDCSLSGCMGRLGETPGAKN